MLAEPEAEVSRHAVGADAGAVLLPEVEVAPLEVEAPGLAEDRLVVVRRRERDAHDRARGHDRPVPFDVPFHLAILVDHHAVAAHELAERRVEESWVGRDALEDVGMAQEDVPEGRQAAVGRLAAGNEQEADERGDLGPREALPGLGLPMGDPGDEVPRRRGHPFLDEPVDPRRQRLVGGDAVGQGRLLARERRDDAVGRRFQVRVLACVHAQHGGDDLEGEGTAERADQVDPRPVRERRDEVIDDRVDQRRVVRLELQPDHLGSDDRPADVVVRSVHLDHRGPDDVAEDALVGLGRVGLVVAEDGRDVVMAREHPAVRDRVVEERLLVAQPLPHGPRIVEVGLLVQGRGVEPARRERHGS